MVYSWLESLGRRVPVQVTPLWLHCGVNCGHCRRIASTCAPRGSASLPMNLATKVPRRAVEDRPRRGKAGQLPATSYAKGTALLHPVDRLGLRLEDEPWRFRVKEPFDDAGDLVNASGI